MDLAMDAKPIYDTPGHRTEVDRLHKMGSDS